MYIKYSYVWITISYHILSWHTSNTATSHRRSSGIGVFWHDYIGTTDITTESIVKKHLSVEQIFVFLNGKETTINTRAVWDKPFLLCERCGCAWNLLLLLILQRFLKLLYSGCIIIYVSMYQCTYQSTDVISGLAAGGAWDQFEVCLKMTIEWTERCTGRPWSSEFGDALGGRCRVNYEMHLQAVIKRVRRCNWRRRCSELRDAHGGRDRASLNMHLDSKIEWTQRCTVRPWSSEFEDAFGGRDRVNWEMQVAAVIERCWRCTGRAWSSEIGDVLGGGQFGGGRWEARMVLGHYSSSGELETVRM